MAEQSVTRSSDYVFLIGHPLEHLTGARLPSGQDVMKNVIYYQCSLKCTITDSANKVYEELMAFWLKSNLPTRCKDHVIKKIKDLYAEHANLMKNRSRGNQKDLENQIIYCQKLDKLFDISHASSEQLLCIEEDKQFLKLQQESRRGVIGPIDKKKAERDARTLKRKSQAAQRAEREKDRVSNVAIAANEIETFSEEESEPRTDEDDAYELDLTSAMKPKKSRAVLTGKLAATLDRTNTSVRKSTMIMASVKNVSGSTSELLPLSKSTVHRHRKHLRELSARDIKQNYNVTKSVVHWDSKLIPAVNGSIDRLPVLVTSIADGETKLLGVPTLPSGSGNDTSQAVINQLHSWQCDSMVIGMCFDTTASITGKHSGACQLLEVHVGRTLLWLACRHDMHDLLLSDVFNICFGPSSGPEILFCKRFREGWDKLSSHEPHLGQTPRIEVPHSLRTFIMKQLTEQHQR